ncbi:MAG: hypothetical protein ACPGCP_04340, partial [Candidatus Nanopelagicales bacterium]
MRPSLIALVAAFSLSAFSFGAVPSAHATSVPDTRVGDSRQVIVVEAPRWSSTEGTLTAFEKRRG